MIEILLFVYENFLGTKDKFILSKAHASFPLCILLREKASTQKIKTHLEIDEKNGVNCTNWKSRTLGLPIATGMAFARKNKIKKENSCLNKRWRMSGRTTWESLLIASKYKLDNLFIIVDYNKLQALSKLQDALPLNNLLKNFNLLIVIVLK